MYACVCTDWKPVSVPGLKCKLCQRLRHGEVTREAGTQGQQTLVVTTRTHNGKAQPLTAFRQTAYCTLRQAYPPPCRPTDGRLPAHSRLQFPPQTAAYRPIADYSSLHRPPLTGAQPITVPSTDRPLPAHSRLQFPPQTAAYRPQRVKGERGCSTRPCRRPLIPLFGSGIPDQQTASPTSSDPDVTASLAPGAQRLNGLFFPDNAAAAAGGGAAMRQVMQHHKLHGYRFQGSFKHKGGGGVCNQERNHRSRLSPTFPPRGCRGLNKSGGQGRSATDEDKRH